MGIGFFTFPGNSKILSVTVFSENYYEKQVEEPILPFEIERSTQQKLHNAEQSDNIAPWQSVTQSSHKTASSS
jgi:hypothetical protein